MGWNPIGQMSNKSISQEKGLTSLLVPNTFFANEYSFKIRKFLLNENNLHELCNLGLVFDDAVVETTIVTYGGIKTDSVIFKNGLVHGISLSINEIETLTDDSKFLLGIDNRIIGIVTRMNKFPKLANFAKVWRGLTTGDDKKFISSLPLSNTYKPLITGADVNKYLPLIAKKYINYLPDELDRARDERIFLLESKLISKFVGKILTFAFDESQNYVLNSGCVTENLSKNLSIKYLLGVLNSRVVNFYFSNIFTDNRETFPIMKSGNIESLPIPKVEQSEQQPIIHLVEKILSLKSNNPQADTQLFEDEIDELVFGLYGLSATERAVVLGG